MSQHFQKVEFPFILVTRDGHGSWSLYSNKGSTDMGHSIDHEEILARIQECLDEMSARATLLDVNIDWDKDMRGTINRTINLRIAYD